jgi:geranylgeranyl pyrophosphate synthase
VSLTAKKTAYHAAYQQGLDYFQILLKFSQNHLDTAQLGHELQHWQQHQSNSLLWRFSTKIKNPPLTEFRGTIRYLIKYQQLKPFIDRSVEYIYLRDLGKGIHKKTVQKKCSKTSEELQQWLLKILAKQESQSIPLSQLFDKLQQWDLQDSFIWFYEKILSLQKQLPESIDHTRIIRQISKLTLGVLMHQLDDLSLDNLSEKQRLGIHHAIKIGYYYGLTYPFIDDFLDADSVLTKPEQATISEMISSTLINNQVVAMKIDQNSPNYPLIQFVYQELHTGFQYIQAHYPPEKYTDMYNTFYIFYYAQEVDRKKSLDNPHYSNEELFIPCILKSSCSRLLPKLMLGKTLTPEFKQIILLTGLFNQLHDDFSDLSEDKQANAVTPYTYYLKYHRQRPDLINPYQLYWSLIQYIGINIYGKDNRQVLSSLLNRSIANHHQQMANYGKAYLNNLLQQFSFINAKHQFLPILQQTIAQYCAPPYLDKLLKINIEIQLAQKQSGAKQYQQELEQFSQRFNQTLALSSTDKIKDKLHANANYSLQAGGKRLRPWLSYLIGCKAYNISEKHLLPLLRSIEYMHTASLIFDDLPSQDNALQRRGVDTLHTYCQSTASAELSALVLIFQAIEQQTQLLNVKPEYTLQLMRYSAEVSQNICHGQQLDLHSQKVNTQKQLEQLSHYKTGYAIEAALLMPAILAQASKKTLQCLKDFAYHAGLVFQIKDDILDQEGNLQQLGKATHMDEQDQSSFVVLLGIEKARALMWKHYFSALKQLNGLPFNANYLRQTLELMLLREH